LIFFVGFYALIVPLPLYLTHAGLPDWQIGVILGAFGIASLVGRPAAGILTDAWGSRRVMLLGAGSLLVGAVGISLDTHPAILFVMRVFQAAGYVAFTTAATALVSHLAHPERRGAALARFGVATNIAVTLTPAAIGEGLRERALTLTGALWLAGALAAVSGLLALWIPRSSRVRTPAAPRSLWRIPGGLGFPMAAAGLFGVGYGAFLQFLPLLTERRGLGTAGLAYTAYGVGIITTRLVTARLLDRGDRRPVLILAFALMATGLAGFAVAGSQVSLWMAALIFSVGSGIVHPSLIAIHVERTPRDERGRAAAAFYLGFDLGVGVGTWVLAPIFQRWGLDGLYLVAAAAVIPGTFLAPAIAARPGRANES